MTGMVQGGWEFVQASYLITFVALGLYGWNTWRRLRAEKERS